MKMKTAAHHNLIETGTVEFLMAKTPKPVPSPDSAPTPKHIHFEPLPPNPSTLRWAVKANATGHRIGLVSWYGPWRKYCFFPEASTLFEQDCLRDLAQFIETQTQLHRAKAKTKPASPIS